MLQRGHSINSFFILHQSHLPTLQARFNKNRDRFLAVCAAAAKKPVGKSACRLAALTKKNTIKADVTMCLGKIDFSLQTLRRAL